MKEDRKEVIMRIREVVKQEEAGARRTIGDDEPEEDIVHEEENQKMDISSDEVTGGRVE